MRSESVSLPDDLIELISSYLHGFNLLALGEAINNEEMMSQAEKEVEMISDAPVPEGEYLLDGSYITKGIRYTIVIPEKDWMRTRRNKTVLTGAATSIIRIANTDETDDFGVYVIFEGKVTLIGHHYYKFMWVKENAFYGWDYSADVYEYKFTILINNLKKGVPTKPKLVREGVFNFS